MVHCTKCGAMNAEYCNCFGFKPKLDIPDDVLSRIKETFNDNDDYLFGHSCRTTNQMKNAVGGSIYIWPNVSSIDYAINLARDLGREDLMIYAVSDLMRIDKFLGIDIYGIEIDHACELTNYRHYDTLESITNRIKRTPMP